MRSKARRVVAVVVTTVLLASGIWWMNGENSASAEVDRIIDSQSLNESAASARPGSYQAYIQQYRHMPQPKEIIQIVPTDYEQVEGMSSPAMELPQGASTEAIATGDEGTITWRFHVQEAGLYRIEMNIKPLEGKDSDIERELLLDGQLPFTEARNLMFPRIWGNKQEEILRDPNGNDLTPRQQELVRWQTVQLHDASGYETEPFLFYLSEGAHTMSFISVKEPLAISSIKLYNPPQIPAYKEWVSANEGMEPVSDVLIKVQGEAASGKSSPTLLPVSHRASPAIEPFHVSKQRNNMMGAYAWRHAGQWLEWEVEVPKDGLYTLSVKHLQNYLPSMSSLRTLMIDGSIPFAEAKRIGFPYSTDWQLMTIGNSEGDPYLFPLKQGKHTIRLEVTLGELAPIIRSVESSVLELNSLYRKIISFTGTVPDSFRDYELDKRIPEMTEIFMKQYKLLSDMATMIEGSTGRKDRTAMLTTLAYQLQDLANRPDTVPSRVESFKTNVGALGAWIPTITEQPLAIDYLLVASSDAKLPDPNATRLEQMWAGMQSFAATFYENYDEFDTADGVEQRTLDVWLTSARDQALVLKRLIEDRFTPESGISVRLKLVPATVLLPSAFSGNGPDVAIQVGNELPVNYASRGAVLDISHFPDYEEVTKRFLPSAMEPFKYGDKTYGLPENQTFPVMFYRKDILVDELGLSVPETWDDMRAIIPKLQKKHLQVGLPERNLNSIGNEVANTDIVTMAPNPTYMMLLYQHGGELYRDEGLASALDEEIAVQMFKQWTDMYVNFKLPIQVDFGNRFRTGEMPIGIYDYTLYNKLNVFAPEIKGLWEFAPVPGVRQPDGSIRRDTASGGTAAMIFKSTKDEEAAWTFLKWWSSKEAQLQFGREMEVRMGVSARYPTANVEAFEALPWQAKDLKKLQEQMKWVRAVPEVPGGYMTGRHLNNAFLKVVVQGEDARETLDDYVRAIDEEIRLKRVEFNLPYEK